MSGRFDKNEILAKIGVHPKRADAFLLLFLSSLLILGFGVPSIVHPIPTGTDVYTHLFYTRELTNVNSLSAFYEQCFEKNYLGYDYPFGLWLFGSIVAKITGMDMLELSRILPFAIMLVLLILYYSYAKKFGKSEEQFLLPLILLLSMPIICIGILGYSTSIFVRSFLIIILYLMLLEKLCLWKRVLLMNVFIFPLCFTHTGTYMFLLSLTVIYLLIYAVLYGDFHRNAYMATASVMFIFIITMHLFPFVHPQYIDKGRILVSVGDFVASELHVPFSGELAEMFYEQIFVNLNPLYVAIMCLSIYAICKLLIFLHQHIKTPILVLAHKIKEKVRGKFFAIPIIGSIRQVSHGVLYWPFWLGPVHVVLAAIGVLRTNRKGLCMLLSVAAVTLLTGYMTGERALRELEYFFVIIPILAALGFYHAKTKIESHMHTNAQKFFVTILLLIVFSSFVVLPVVGNLYYHPIISGEEYERTGLHWLSGIGEPNEGCAGWGYRHMISVYANKTVPGSTTIAAGSETKRFGLDYRSVCLNMGGEEYADDLYATFGVNYILISDRVLSKGLGVTDKELKVDDNRKLDKIYSTKDFFSLYKYIPVVTQRTSITPQLNFADSALIEDAGGSYLVETGEYKVRLSKATPGILYIGTKTTNFLGEGGTYDYILITWSGPHSEQVNGYVLSELFYSSVVLGDNQIVYETVLKNENGSEDWATLTVKCTFFEKAMKREIFVANDWVNDSVMNARVTMMLLTPMNYFMFQNEDSPAKKRTIYPSEDAILLKKLRFNKIFINESKEGIYISYDKTAPYPNSITYSGLMRYLYEYYSLDMIAEKSVSPSETVHLTQWISVGDEQTAKSNVEHYTSVAFYPYPNGEIPIILTSRVPSLNGTSEEDFFASLRAHEKFREVGAANYTEAVNLQDKELNKSRMGQLLEHGAYVTGYEAVEGFNLTIQQGKIERMQENADSLYGINLTGFMPKDLRYDLDTIKVLAEQNMTFITAKRILPAFDIYFQEGLRQPQMTYYHGKKTGVVLLPVSEPLLAGPTYYYDDYSEAWKAVIDSVIKNDELCVFVWDSDKASTPEHINDTINVINYTKEKGMTFTTPYEIAKHFVLLQNVSAFVSRSDDGSSKITISVSNDNEEPVRGVTFRVELPGTAEYAVNNGQIVRKTYSASKCIYYVSTDLASKETKEIVLDIPGYR